MILSFQERFRNKSSFMGKQGGLNIEDSTSISKPQKNQLFIEEQYSKFKELNPPDGLAVPVIPNELRKPAKLTPRPARNPPPLVRDQTQSANPYRNIEVIPRDDIKTSQGSKPIPSFKPYTFKDYQNIRSHKYYELGGLGPAQIGNDDWKQKKEINDRRIIYAKQVNFVNGNQFTPESNLKYERCVNSGEQSTHSSKRIQRTLNQAKILVTSSVPAINSVLEELENQYFSSKHSAVKKVSSSVHHKIYN